MCDDNAASGPDLSLRDDSLLCVAREGCTTAEVAALYRQAQLKMKAFRDRLQASNKVRGG